MLYFTLVLCFLYWDEGWVKMKRFFLIFLIIVIISVIFAGCNNKSNISTNDKIKVISTIFPYYDFTRQISSDKVELTLLLPPGNESHSYEPSAKDIVAIENCDLFIYTGGESDAWVENLLDSFDVEINTLKVMDYIEPISEDLFEENDEHIWTSPQNAILITELINNELKKIDNDNSSIYDAMTNNYTIELDSLDKEFIDFFNSNNNNTLVFGDRFPFRYFAESYSLDYKAVFPGCSSETEVSAAGMADIINYVKDENIKTVFYLEFSNHKIADAIAEATNTNTAMLHSCHNVSKEDLDNGATYISIMKHNLDTLKEALK